MALRMEDTANTGQHKVVSGRRVVGFITYFPAIAGIGRREGWTFIPNRGDIAAMYPAPSPVFDDLAAAFRHVSAYIE